MCDQLNIIAYAVGKKRCLSHCTLQFKAHACLYIMLVFSLEQFFLARSTARINDGGKLAGNWLIQLCLIEQGGREVDEFIKYLSREATDELSGYSRDGKKIKAKKTDL